MVPTMLSPGTLIHDVKTNSKHVFDRYQSYRFIKDDRVAWEGLRYVKMGNKLYHEKEQLETNVSDSCYV